MKNKQVCFSKTRNKICLILILILATFLRFYQLNQNPPSLNWDEVSHGYNAYSILKTGKDEWGVSFPTIFRAYGDYKLPVYIYLTSLSVGLFGLNEFAVRFPSVLAGILSVLFTYLLVKKLFSSFHLRGVPPAGGPPSEVVLQLLNTSDGGRMPSSEVKSETVAFLSAFFLAISPWHIFLSRPAFEANIASFLVIAGAYFFFLGLEKKWFLPVGILFLGLSVHTYNSARIFTPLFLILLFSLYYGAVIEWARKRKREVVLAGLILVLLFVPLVVSFASPSGWARFKWVTILDQGAINRINMARGSSSLPKPLPRLIHNKATYFTLAFTKNYFSNLSPRYLFLTGGSNYQYNIPGRGIIYPIQAPEPH